MREEFTDRLRSCLDNAQDQARGLNQDFVSTEHLLLGLLSVDESEAVEGLRLAGVDVGELRSHVSKSLPRGGEAPVVTGALPLSPKARRAINLALVKAQSVGRPRVSSRMLLCALMEECDTVVGVSMRAVGADVDHLHRVLMQDGAIAPEK